MSLVELPLLLEDLFRQRTRRLQRRVRLQVELSGERRKHRLLRRPGRALQHVERRLDVHAGRRRRLRGAGRDPAVPAPGCVSPDAGLVLLYLRSRASEVLTEMSIVSLVVRA